MAYNCGEATSLLIEMKELQKDYNTLSELSGKLFDLEFDSLVNMIGEQNDILQSFKAIIDERQNEVRLKYIKAVNQYTKLN